MPFLAPLIAAISVALAPAITFLTTTFVGRLLVSVAASALMQALASKPKKGPAGGISTTVTQTGGLNPGSFILGTYATAGTHVCPPMSHDGAGGSPLAYLTYVIELGDIPGQTLDRVIINDEYVTLGSPVHAYYGQSVQGRYLGYAWVKYYDGSQTSADPGLIAEYASYSPRVWTTDMIGRGLCYAILTFRLKADLWQGFPRVRFEMGGIPLYDIRKDSTAGGAGVHRWATVSTWEPTVNPMVMIYNILRGITLADGSVWGGRIAGSDLDAGSWMAAMNECDVASPAAKGGTEAQFRAGIEASLDQEPADVIAELLKACSGQIAEVAGRWKARAGGPGLPVFVFTDADVVVSQPQDLTPFPGLEASFNAIHASYPEPVSLWESKDAPPRYNAAYEAEDQGRRRVADLGLPAVPYAAQVQRLMVAYIKEERRFRRHGLTLPPDAAILEPLDAVSWTSTVNGYVSKVFEVSEVTDDLRTCLQRVALRERDPADYSYPVDILLPTAPGVPGPVLPASQSVPGWNVTGVAITDAAAAARRPGLLLSWTGSDQDDVRAIRFEVRVTATGTVIRQGSTHDVETGQLVVCEGILPNVSYQARGRFVVDRPTTWSPWVTATAPNVGISNADYVGGIGTFLNGNQASWGEVVTVLPATGNWFGRQVILAGNSKNYLWNGTAWVTGVEAADIIGTLVAANFATSLRPPETVSALPTTGNYQGRQVFLTTDNKLYRHTGSPAGSAGFIRSTNGADIEVNSIIAGRFVAGAIAADDIAGEQIAARHLLVSDFENLLLNGAFQTGNFETWSSVGAGLSVVAQGTAGFGSYVTMPSRYCLAALDNGTEQVVEFNRATPVIPGQSLAVSMDLACGGAVRNSTWTIRAFFRDNTGAYLSAPARSEIITTTTWVRRVTAPIVVPTGAVEMYKITITREAGGSGTPFLTNLLVRRMSGGELVVDGFLAVMGMAAFGGDLQSTGYNPGVAGWRIRSTGVAEFHDLVVRSWLRDGSVSDKFQTIAAGPFAGVTASTVVATLDLGAVPRGNVYHRGVVFEARRVTAPASNPTILLERRSKQLGGVFTLWATIQTWEMPGTAPAADVWDVYSDSGTLSGYYDDFEYRLSYSCSATDARDMLRNVYITVVRATK